MPYGIAGMEWIWRGALKEAGPAAFAIHMALPLL
jgi:hypothetical protein